MISLTVNNSKIPNIDTVLFDKDGTFIDLHYFWGKMTTMRCDEIIKTYSMPVSLHHELCLCLGYDTKTQKMLKDGITALYSRPKIIEIFRSDLKKYGVNATQQEIEKIFDHISSVFYKNMQTYTKPIDSAVEFFKTLAQSNIKLGIVTSDSVESTQLTLKHFGWEKYFGAVIGRESSDAHKESGIPAKMALEILQSNPTNTVMIGDAPMDYMAAKNADITTTILVATGQIEREELQQHSPYAVNTLNEVYINK